MVSVKLIEWGDYEQEVARLWNLSSALKEAREKKEALEGKLYSLNQNHKAHDIQKRRRIVDDNDVLLSSSSPACTLIRRDVPFSSSAR
ncbi:unnamed protein product [Linum tenue]|uniref:Uncharacterized protein n=1 Tax=Linum tenue TaxID=586396 RepID=A0AAV0MIU3_9ROSI|nr:unnamed protein product [Linum tenue]